MVCTYQPSVIFRRMPMVSKSAAPERLSSFMICSSWSAGIMRSRRLHLWPTILTLLMGLYLSSLTTNSTWAWFLPRGFTRASTVSNRPVLHPSHSLQSLARQRTSVYITRPGRPNLVESLFWEHSLLLYRQLGVNARQACTDEKLKTETALTAQDVS